MRATGLWWSPTSLLGALVSAQTTGNWPTFLFSVDPSFVILHKVVVHGYEDDRPEVREGLASEVVLIWVQWSTSLV